MKVPDGYFAVDYDLALLVKGQLIAHFYSYDGPEDEDEVEIGVIHCKPTKNGVRWVKYAAVARPYSAGLKPEDYLDLWCFVEKIEVLDAIEVFSEDEEKEDASPAASPA